MVANVYLTSLALLLADSTAPKAFSPTGETPYLSPADELATIEVADGYRLELVLSEPEIREPVSLMFDGNGRMYVAEMHTYMQDIDGTDEFAPKSRVSRHESSRGDGRFDRHTVFADGLLLPRMMLPLDDRLIIGETNTNDLFVYRDTNGDGVSDQKLLFYEGGPRGGNLEHQPNGLLWSLDNWLYSTYNAYRLRWTPLGVLKEPTAPNGGQWGVTQDDRGKVWFSNAGGERGITNFQTHIAYGAFNVPQQQDADFREVFPLVGIPDVQGGQLRFRPGDKTLNHFTGTCGQTVYRGDRLPADLRGDVLLAEPVGRLIRRIKVEMRDGITHVRNQYPKSEFIRSIDPNFRPVNMTTGPDGAIYIVDMYRGIIQEGNWVRKDSYLRTVVKAHGLQNNFGRGRIWRLVHEGWKPGPQPRMLAETPQQLVRQLAHPNGWWRDTAQKLLVLRGDRTVVPQLQAMARSHANQLARIHALWTLEGLDALTPELIGNALSNRDAAVRESAVRVAESWLRTRPEHPLRARVTTLAQDPDPTVVIQVLGTARRAAWPDHRKLLRETVAGSSSEGVQEIGGRLLRMLDENETKGMRAEDVAMMERGRGIYNELCFACHGEDGKGAALLGATADLIAAAKAGGQTASTIAPALMGSNLVLKNKDVAINILLHGLTGPVDGQTYAAAMVPMRDNDDAWIAAVLSYVRNSFGNRAPLITPAEVALVRGKGAPRPLPWTAVELTALPKKPASR